MLGSSVSYHPDCAADANVVLRIDKADSLCPESFTNLTRCLQENRMGEAYRFCEKEKAEFATCTKQFDFSTLASIHNATNSLA